MSQAFTIFPAPSCKIEDMRPITAPPATNVDMVTAGTTVDTLDTETGDHTNTGISGNIGCP